VRASFWLDITWRDDIICAMRTKVATKAPLRKINLDRYSGKWVAFINNQPVICADNLSILMQKIKKEPLSKEPSVMLVPRKDEGPYILILI
jgi:hypothetical protein